MLKEKIWSAIVKLNEISDKVDKETWEDLGATVRELKDCLEIAANWEQKVFLRCSKLCPDKGYGHKIIYAVCDKCKGKGYLK